MTASEARRIAESCVRGKLSTIQKQIEEYAKKGLFKIKFDSLDEKTMYYLKINGYTIQEKSRSSESYRGETYRETYYEVSW